MLPEKLIGEIIKEQSLIIGEQLAKSRAEDSGVLKFNSLKLDDVSIGQGNPVNAIEKLVSSYAEVFGKASIEVCVDVIKRHPYSEVNYLLPDTIKSRILN